MVDNRPEDERGYDHWLSITVKKSEAQAAEIARLTAELAQARAERDAAADNADSMLDDIERSRYDIWQLANEYGAETASVDPKDVEENIRALLRIGDRPPLIERQRRTIWALVVAGRAIHRTLWQALDQYEINDRGIVRDMRQHVIGLNIEHAKQSGQQAGE